MGYKKVKGRIIRVEGTLGDIRLGIDVAKGYIKRVFTGDIELEKLKNQTVLVHIPKIKNKKKKD